MASTEGHFPVVLVNPPVQTVREEIYDTPDYPEIGLAYVAGYLETHGGIRATVIDARLARLSRQDTIDKVAALQPRVVGFSAFTHMITRAAELAREVKRRLPGVITVIGGYHASVLPERTLREFPEFDYAVVGEGEIAFLKLITALAAGERRPVIPGVWYLWAGTVVPGGRGEVTAQLDDFGLPAWHLFDQAVVAANVKLIPIMSLRGCPFSCNFCSRPYGQVVRRRSPASVVGEIERAVAVYGVRKLQFYDETFNVNKAHTVGICEEIIRRGVTVSWSATVHANAVSLEVVTLMKKAGCTSVAFGAESGDDDIIAAMKKGVTRESIASAARIFKQVGIRCMALFILGHPNETLRTAWASVRFAAALDPDTVSFGIMVPYPGTEIWDMARRGEGGYRKLSESWDDYNKIIGKSVELVHMPRWRLEMVQVLGYLYFFLATRNFRELFRILVQERKRVWSLMLNIVRGPSTEYRPVMVGDTPMP